MIDIKELTEKIYNLDNSNKLEEILTSELKEKFGNVKLVYSSEAVYKSEFAELNFNKLIYCVGKENNCNFYVGILCVKKYIDVDKVIEKTAKTLISLSEIINEERLSPEEAEYFNKELKRSFKPLYSALEKGIYLKIIVDEDKKEIKKELNMLERGYLFRLLFKEDSMSSEKLRLKFDNY
ncbi:MAG: hypothetical protein QXL82_00245 [Candidatus Aenigmatarchaeota archaeon]